MHTFVKNHEMLEYYDYIIIGAGIAGLKAAETIRQYDVSGKILMVNGEDRLPYKRTSISKRLSAGFQKEELALKPAEWYEKMTIELVDGLVTEVLTATKEVILRNGRIRWNKLIFCTGSTPIEINPMLPPLTGLYYFRNAEDVDFIRSQNIVNEHIVIIGGGVQGIELIEQMLSLGNKVSLIHHANILMNRHFDEFMAGHLLQLLKEKGVEVFLETKVKSIQKTESQVFEIILDQGEPLYCNKIIVSIGTKPTVDLAHESGLEINNGILVNQFLQASHPDVYAAGDVAEHPGGWITGLWHAAEKQGIIAGTNATGQECAFEKTTFRLKLNFFYQYYFSMNPQHANIEIDEQILHKGDKYYRFFFKNNLLQGVLMMNDKDNAKYLEDSVRKSADRELIMRVFA
jgi:NAD(P)H-nitrite reductase large subunit